MLGAFIDDLMLHREAQSSPKPILGHRFSKSVALLMLWQAISDGREADFLKFRGPENIHRQRTRRAATVLSLIDELANLGETAEEETPGEESPIRTRPVNPPEERYKG